MNNFKKSEVGARILFQEYKRKDCPAILLKRNKKWLIKNENVEWNVSTNWNGQWLIKNISKDRYLVWHEKPGIFRYFKISKEAMRYIMGNIEGEHIRQGKEIYNDETGMLEWITRDPQKQWKMLVIDPKNNALHLQLILPYEIFNN